MSTGSSPQFDVAHFSGKDVCALCSQPVGSSYYRVGGLMTCVNCALARKNNPEAAPRGSFAGALVWGFVAALGGLVLYSTVGIVTGYEIGFVSLAVGYMVGKAVLKGSGGVGGRRYQMAALLFTYFAVSTSAIPITIAHFIAQEPAAAEAQESAGETAGDEAPGAETEKGEDEGEISLGQAILLLLGLGLVSPFLGLLDFPRGLIGLVILFVGLHIAWRMTAAAQAEEIDGPFENTPAPGS